MNDAHRPRSVVVDQSSAAGAKACPGNSASSTGPVGVGLDEEPGGERRDTRSRRTPHLQRVEDALLQHLRPRLSPQPGHDLAQQRVREVAVVVAPSRRQDSLGLLETGQQVVDRRAAQALPDVADRLALQAGQVREHPAHGQVRVPGARQVLVEGVVEVEQAVVAALHDQHGGEGLGDRADPELRVRVGTAVGVVGVGRAGHPCQRPPRRCVRRDAGQALVERQSACWPLGCRPGQGRRHLRAAPR